MKLNLPSVNQRLERLRKAIKNRDDSSQISARAAKLMADIGTGKISSTEAMARAVSLYLRRQEHVYGDAAYSKTLDEIMAFLTEAGDTKRLLNLEKLRNSTNGLNNVDLENHDTIVKVYNDKGLYGLVQLIESQSTIKTRTQKATKLLGFGKILKAVIGEPGIRNKLAEMALELDKSEVTYRGACWSMLNDGLYEKALELFAYLYFYHLQSSDGNNYFKALEDKFYSHFGQEYIESYLKENEEEYQQLIYNEHLERYRQQLSLTDRQQQQLLFGEILKELGANALIDVINLDSRVNNKGKALLALRAVKAAKDVFNDTNVYIETVNTLADYAYSKDTSESTLRNVYFSYQKAHAYEKSAEVLVLLKHLAGNTPTQKQKNLLWSAPDHLIKLADQVPKFTPSKAYEPIAGRVCYVIHNSLPYSSGGYATRGHGLLSAIAQQGVDIYAVTRPGYPHDISSIKPEKVAKEDIVNGQTYKRILSPSRRDYSNYEYMLKAAQSYKKVFKRDRPALVIAASNHLDSLPVMFAARELGIPFIYEIRGFWEITRLSKYPEFEQSPMFEVEKKLEAVVAQNANHIFTLTQGMIDELESRDVDTTDRVTLLPNSCDANRFHPTDIKDSSLAAKWDIPLDVPVIGYVGTLVSYEGLDDLAKACSKLKSLGYAFRLLIVGNENATGQGKGSIVDQLQSIADEAGYGDWLIMPGRVPFEEVERYYSLIDIAPFPRKAWPVCEIVPPMKTLEALAMQKAVIVSSNKALTEMITHDVNGRVFERGDVEDLTSQLKYLLDNPDKWAGYGTLGRQFVENERTWQRTAQKAVNIIKKFI